MRLGLVLLMSAVVVGRAAPAKPTRKPKPIKCLKGEHLVDHYPDGIHNKPECRPDWDSGEIGVGKNDIGVWTCAKCTNIDVPVSK